MCVQFFITIEQNSLFLNIFDIPYHCRNDFLTKLFHKSHPQGESMSFFRQGLNWAPCPRFRTTSQWRSRCTRPCRSPTTWRRPRWNSTTSPSARTTHTTSRRPSTRPRPTTCTSPRPRQSRATTPSPTLSKSPSTKPSVIRVTARKATRSPIHKHISISESST